MLAAGATLLALATTEFAFRLLVLLDNRGLSFTALNNAATIPEDGNVELGHIIRRSTHRRLVYELKPDLDVTFFGVPMRTNSQGLRSPDRAPERDAFTIVGLGDSIMFGQGVPGELGYLAVLEALFETHCPEANLRTENMAVSGYNTVMEVESLKVKGLELLPDLVVIEFVGNDLSMPNFIRQPRRAWDPRRSYALDFLRFRAEWFWQKSFWREMELAGLESIPMEDPLGVGHLLDPREVPENYRDLVGWQAFARAMEELQRLGVEHDFEILMVSLQVRDGGLKEKALEHARYLGFDTLDVGRQLSRHLRRTGEDGYADSPLSLDEQDLHPSAQGHRIAANTLYRHLAESRKAVPGCVSTLR